MARLIYQDAKGQANVRAARIEMARVVADADPCEGPLLIPLPIPLPCPYSPLRGALQPLLMTRQAVVVPARGALTCRVWYGQPLALMWLVCKYAIVLLKYSVLGQGGMSETGWKLGPNHDRKGG
jgi:hypothetical protein